MSTYAPLPELSPSPYYPVNQSGPEIVAPPPFVQENLGPVAGHQIAQLPSLSEEDVEEAAAKYVSEQCCYGDRVVKEMKINDIIKNSAFHYTLETFCERRETVWKFVPYGGGLIDGPQNGIAPGPWEVVAHPSGYFIDSKKEMEVPRTAYVKPCHECVGNRRIRCQSCIGNGQVGCSCAPMQQQEDRMRMHHGISHNPPLNCQKCNGSGHIRCLNCQGTGQVQCNICNGFGQLKGFVHLTITWKNHLNDQISNSSSLPEKEVRKVVGLVVFEEEKPMVWPLNNVGGMNISQVSRDIIQRHREQFTNEKILRQRHCLRVVPITEVNYTWEAKHKMFFVYGSENKVYFDKYPQRCCCCCTIM